MINKIFSDHKKTLLIIIFFGFFIRIFGVWDMPPSPNWDEVSHGYNAYSILKTGKDEWGKSFPTIFQAYGDYKLPVYIYVTSLSIAIFGLNTFAVRLPSVIFGTLSILFTYLLVKKVLKNEEVSIYAALLMAISPWSFFLSRIALEANVALTLIIGGVYYVLNGLEKKNRELLYGAFFLSLSVWTYNSARIFVPLIILSILAIFRKNIAGVFKKNKSIIFISALTLVIFLVPMFKQLLNTEGSARYENVQILDVGAIAEINDRRQKAELPSIIERILYNKVTYFSEQFTGNYVRHFSPIFLFIEGGDNYQFNIPGHGLLYLVTFPALVYGVYLMFKKLRDNPEVQLVFAWLVFSPVAASITRESPHTLRSIMLMTPLIILTAYGFFEIKQKYQKSIPNTAYFILILISSIAYAKYYTVDYRNAHSFAWQYGYEQVAEIIKENYDDYEKIVITKKYAEPHEFMLFYLKVDPNDYRNDPNLIRFGKSDWFWVDRFDKYYFVNDWEIPETSSRFKLESGEEFDCASCILFTGENNAPEGWRKIDEIKFLNGEVAFEVYEH